MHKQPTALEDFLILAEAAWMIWPVLALLLTVTVLMFRINKHGR